METGGNPRLGDIRKDWIRVKSALQTLLQKAQQDWIPEDVYHECMSDQALYFCTDEGFVVAKVIKNGYTGENSLFIWVAVSYSTGGDNMGKHLPFFEQVARDLDCAYLGTATPFKPVGGLLERNGWREVTTTYERPVN